MPQLCCVEILKIDAADMLNINTLNFVKLGTLDEIQNEHPLGFDRLHLMVEAWPLF